MNIDAPLEIARQLISFDSVSSRSNADAAGWVEDRLRKAGFEVEILTYHDRQGELKVNVVARRAPRRPTLARGGIAYLAHTDVVPADDWGVDFCGPFQPTVRDGRLYGRGSCDMKGSLACALAAAEMISPADQQAPIYFVVTADEELYMHGARHVDQHSQLFNEMVAAGAVGIVGEPTLLRVIHAHKGGIALRLTAHGRSAHSSTQDGINANHQLIPILPLLLELQRESEADPSLRCSMFAPPTLSWNIALRNEPFAANITPSKAEAVVLLRPMPGVEHEPLIARVEQRAAELGLHFERSAGGHPFHVDPQSPFVQAMLELTGNRQAETVCYGTDGAVLRRLDQMVICGPGSIEQAHRNDEWIALTELARGTDLYHRAFQRWAC